MKKPFITLALTLAFLLAATAASAQMKFLADGQSGFGLAAAYIAGEDFSGIGGSANYTVRGAWDLGLTVNRLSLDDASIGNDGSATAVVPWLALGLVRPKAGANLGAELMVAYEMDSYSSDGLDALGWDMSSHAVTGLVSAYLRLESSPSLTVFPEVNLGYITGTAKIEDSVGGFVDTDINEAVFGAGVNLLFNQKVRVSPSFATMDGNTTWSVAVGLVMPSR